MARRHAEEAYADYTTKRSVLADRAQRQREWSLQGVSKVRKSGENDKHIRHFRSQASEHVAAKAKITERAAERLEVVEKPWEGWQLRMEIAAAPRSGSVVARLDEAVVHRGDFVLGPIDLEIGWAERVAILGPNGSGKTTLLRALLGEIELASGERRLGPGVVVGTLEQARGRFLGRATLLDAFGAASGLLVAESRSLLAKFGLAADHVGRAPATLSPGERTRAELALLSATGVNCLVLDEPTNHLDLPAIEQLEQALESFEGTLLVVTHDRGLLETLRFTRRVEIGDGRLVADQAVYDHDRYRALYWARIRVDSGEVGEAPVELGVLVVPEVVHRVEVLVGDRAPVLVVGADRAELGFEVPDADTQRHPAVAQHVETRDLLREHDRIESQKDHDAAARRMGWTACRGPREREQRVECRVLRSHRRRRHLRVGEDDVLARPTRSRSRPPPRRAPSSPALRASPARPC